MSERSRRSMPVSPSQGRKSGQIDPQQPAYRAQCRQSVRRRSAEAPSRPGLDERGRLRSGQCDGSRSHPLASASQALVSACGSSPRRGKPRAQRAAWLLAAAAADDPVHAAAGATLAVRDLVEIADIDSLGVSPDGQYLAFRTVRANVARNSYDLEWHSVELQSGEVRPIGSGGDPIMSTRAWSKPSLRCGAPTAGRSCSVRSSTARSGSGRRMRTADP